MSWKITVATMLLCLGITQAGSAATGIGVQASREVLGRSLGLQQEDLSKTLQDSKLAATKELQQGDAAAAREALAPLGRFWPVDEFPSVEVQALLRAIALQQGRADDASAHATISARLQAAHLVSYMQAAPEGVGMWNRYEILEWVRTNHVQLSDIRSGQGQDGKSVLTATLKDSKGVSRQQLFQLHYAPAPRYFAIPEAQLEPQQRDSINAARELRESFFKNSELSYLKLRGAMNDAMKAATPLLRQGKRAEALAQLEQVQAQHPVDLIPSTAWLAMVEQSLAHDTVRRAALQQRRFGLEQLMARSGDGRSPESAVEVTFVHDEYDWLMDQQMRSPQQSLLHKDGKTYDSFEVQTPRGTAVIHFDVTRMMQMYRL